MQDKSFFLSQVLLLFGWGGQHLLLFAMNSMLGFDKLALNYSIDSGCPVVFCRAVEAARLQALAAGQPFFYSDFL
jgi:hypothetical protein